MIKIAICDDETVYLKKIEKMIRSYLAEKQVDFKIDCFESGEQLIERSRKDWEYDMVFLDVNMKDVDGIETAKVIRALSESVYIIFITAFITYALEGYKVDAVRYLLKGDDNFEQSMKECMDAVLGKMNYKEEWLKLEFMSGNMKLSPGRILYVESRLHKLVFHVLGDGVKEYSRYDKMDVMEELLRDKGFIRIHQSFLVNMKHVKTIERYKVVLTEGSEISVSKRYYKEAEREYLRAKGEL